MQDQHDACDGMALSILEKKEPGIPALCWEVAL